MQNFGGFLAVFVNKCWQIKTNTVIINHKGYTVDWVWIIWQIRCGFVCFKTLIECPAGRIWIKEDCDSWQRYVLHKFEGTQTKDYIMYKVSNGP